MNGVNNDLLYFLALDQVGSIIARLLRLRSLYFIGMAIQPRMQKRRYAFPLCPRPS